MSKKLRFNTCLFFVVLILSISIVAVQGAEVNEYTDASGNVIIDDEKVANHNLTFAGSKVTVNAIFETTTFFAGNTVSLDGEYDGDVFVTGNTVVINGIINGNLYAGGNVITLNGEVSQDAFITGSELTFSPEANVDRDVFVASANANFDGKIGRNLWVGADNMILNGQVDGFIKTDVDHLTINDSAAVLGSIDHRSSAQAVVSEKANIADVNWQEVEVSQNQEEAKTSGLGSIILAFITKLAFILIMWILLTYLSREFSNNMENIVKNHIWASLGLGIAYLFLTPIIILLAFIIYWPFGVAVTLLIIASLILAMPIAAVTFSKLLLPFFEQKMRPLLASFIALLCLAILIVLIGNISYLGLVLTIIMMVFGSGFLSYNILFAKRQSEEY